MSLPELLTRVKEAKGPDAYIDQELWCEFFAPDVVVIDPGVKFPPYTSSIDAALALVERKLPGWRGDIDTAPFEPGDLCGARFFPPGKITNIAEQAETPPLAILAALLSALISSPPPSDE